MAMLSLPKSFAARLTVPPCHWVKHQIAGICPRGYVVVGKGIREDCRVEMCVRHIRRRMPQLRSGIPKHCHVVNNQDNV